MYIILHGACFKSAAFVFIMMGCCLLPLPSLAEGGALARVNTDGFGDEANTAIYALYPSDEASKLYAGTWNRATGCQVYASDDGAVWTKVAAGGLGSADNFCAASLAWFDGRLYIGTWNMASGAALYRSGPKGGEGSWEAITRDGFGSPDNERITRLCVFNKMLYAATFNAQTGPGIWRSDSGDAGSWQQVNANGWGAPSNSDVSMLTVHDGCLYAGTEALHPPFRGAQLWRTDGKLAAPFDQWQCLNTPGFGKRTNQHIGGIAALDSTLYAATWNGASGLEVWRAPLTDKAPLANWEKAASDGITNPAYAMATGLVLYKKALYLGARGKFALDGELFGESAQVKDATGGALFTSADGNNWRRMEQEGFLTPPTLGVQSMAVFKGRLFIGSFALDSPAQLWAMEDAK